MDGPRDDYTIWSKSEKDKYHLISHMWNLKKMIQMNIDKTERLTNIENKLMVTKREGAGGGEWGDVEFRINKYILLYKNR